MSNRIEKDFLGELEVPAEAYYGVQTQRAVYNFPISGLRQPRAFIRACGLIKFAAATAHRKLGALDGKIADAIAAAAREVIEGEFDDQFVVDVYQAGAGTSHHMNVNEIIANRANEQLGGKRGEYNPVHPNDHVNMGQSTNDVIPTAIRIAALESSNDMLKAMRNLAETFYRKADEFKDIAKSGRTHLQDAVPVTLGQEFRAYGDATGCAADRIERECAPLRSLGIGGSATGSGLNTVAGYREKMAEILSEETGLSLRPSVHLFEAMQSMSPFVGLSGALRAAATEIGRICNDLRLLASGPTTGFGEIILPAVQPGSSIMPGKVNPVIPECLNMICFQVIGNDACIAHAAGAGQLELNVMMPVIGYNLLTSIRILTEGAKILSEKCVAGIEADKERCAEYLASTLGLATVLNPIIGYHKAAEVVREAGASGKNIRQLVIEKGILSESEFDDLVRKSADGAG